jgi:hypothetical protein
VVNAGRRYRIAVYRKDVQFGVDFGIQIVDREEPAPAEAGVNREEPAPAETGSIVNREW